jgi:BirA family biotin operon repressor/biotin-[acetyl-CoA-carboxylase] ligase
LNQPEPVPEDIHAALTTAGDRLGLFDGRLLWYASVGSTNDLAARLAEQGAAEGAVVSADEQTSGRGRLGRDWASPRGAGLYVSLVLRPDAQSAALLTIAAGVALAEGIAAATGLAPSLKWPNDLNIGSRKLAGILAEAGVSHVVLGFGINLMPAAYPPDVAARATSLEGELGRPVDRGMVLAECLAAIAQRYAQLRRRETQPAVEAWRRLAAPTLGRAVEWGEGAARRRGIAETIDAAGALLVRTSSGTERIISGEVRWL